MKKTISVPKTAVIETEEQEIEFPFYCAHDISSSDREDITYYKIFDDYSYVSINKECQYSGRNPRYRFEEYEFGGKRIILDVYACLAAGKGSMYEFVEGIAFRKALEELHKHIFEAYADTPRERK